MRNRLILLIAIALLATPHAQQPLFPLRITGSTVTPPTSDPPSLSQDNLTFLGAFNFPTTVGGVGTNSATGTLAIRYVGGTLHFISSLNANDLIYEVTYPGISLVPASYPTATLYANWGDIYQNKRCTNVTTPPDCSNAGSALYGLFWDSVDSRLYWSYGNGYAQDSYTAATGYSTLDDNSINPTTKAGTGTGVGSWRFAPVPPHGKALRSGMLAVPQWFQDTYAPGDRLGAGYGGAYTNGQSASYGPTLMVFNPDLMDLTVPVTAAGPVGGYAPDLPLAVYGGVSANTVSNPALGHRNTRYKAGGNADPSGSIGYWQQCDTTEGGVWVDVPAISQAHPGVSGVMIAANNCQGNMSYLLAQYPSDHHEPWILMHDPHTLGISQGGRLDQVYPTDTWQMLTSFGAEGMAYDPIQQRLYVLNHSAHGCGSSGCPVVFVYQVADTVTPTVPVIYSMTGNVTVNTNSSVVATFNVTGDGKPTPSVTWQTSPDGVTWTPYTGDPLNQPGAYGPQLLYAITDLSQNGLKVRALLTNSQGTATSSTSTITVTGSAPAVPSFTVPPADVTTTNGSTATYTATVAGNPVPQEYVWWTSPDNVTWGDINCSSTCPGNSTHTASYHFTATTALNNLYVKVCAYKPGLTVRNISRTATPSVGSVCSNPARLFVH